MAAAALGHAARRLGGGALRQTQEAAVSRLSSAVERRLAHTEVQHPCNCGKFEKDAFLNRIQKQKEQLFDDMVEGYKRYGKDQDSASRMNRALLRELSDQVCRRSSGDPTWESARKSQLRHDLLKATGFVTLVNVGANLCLNALAFAVRG